MSSQEVHVVFRTGLKVRSFVQSNEFKAFPGAREDEERLEESIVIGARSELITNPWYERVVSVITMVQTVLV